MKQTISIIVIVVALAGAGIFGYMALSKTDPGVAASMPTAASSQILPMGSSLRFDSVQKYNSSNRLYPYPVVNPAEIGVATGAMMSQ